MRTEDTRPRIIETASATTSPDNANSGPFAYIITAIAIGALLLFSAAMGGLCSAIISAAAENSTYAGSSLPFDDYGYTDPFLDDFGNMDFEQYLNDYGNGFGNDQSTSPNNSTSSGTATVGDVLDFSIAPYGNTINDYVSASAYAGIPSEVRDFVRSVVSTDRDYATKVVTALDGAATNADERAARIDEALSLCDEAKGAIEGVRIPEVPGENGTAVKDKLGTAKTESAHRWELMKSEIAMLKDTDTVNTQRLWSVDDDILNSTEKAGDLLVDAMDASKNR
jgi:hypothetical protein